MKYKILLNLAGLSLIMASCSIKEDRGPCPCRLDIDVSDCVRYSDRISISGWDEMQGRLFLDKVSLSDYPDVYSKKIDKGTLKLCAYSGIRSMSLKNNILTIQEGFQCDSILAYTSDLIEAYGDTAEDAIILHKQFACIHIQVDSLTRNTGEILCRAVGNVNGMEVPSLTPKNGSFKCFATPDGQGAQTVNVPRQIDDSLILEVYVNGVLSKDLKIGEMISGSGYSWLREDLDDIFLSINLFSGTSVTVSISGWETERITYMI